MQIGGFLKQSTIDWNGKLAAVVFTRGCNLRCFYCHNPSLVLPELFGALDLVEEKNVFEFMRKRAEFLDGVVVTGGEPTMQPGLLEFLRKLKDLSGLPIKLDTNGTNPEILSAAITEKLANCVAMDIKHRLEYDCYRKISPNLTRAQFKKILESVDILRAADIETVFRTTLIEGVHSQADIDEIARAFPRAAFQKQRKDFPCISDYSGQKDKSLLSARPI